MTTAKNKSMQGTRIILMKYIFNSKNVFLFYLPIKFGFGVDGFVTRTASGFFLHSVLKGGTKCPLVREISLQCLRKRLWLQDRADDSREHAHGSGVIPV